MKSSKTGQPSTSVHKVHLSTSVRLTIACHAHMTRLRGGEYDLWSYSPPRLRTNNYLPGERQACCTQLMYCCRYQYCGSYATPLMKNVIY